MVVPMNYEHLLQSALREFEAKVGNLVEAEFERAHAAMREGGSCEVPIIGGDWAQGDEDELQQHAMQALKCRKWFEFEAPLWCQPLPLTENACVALFNQPNRRLNPIGRYGRMLRGLRWRYETAMRFELFMACDLNPSA
jgi:hypothetical protein